MRWTLPLGLTLALLTTLPAAAEGRPRCDAVSGDGFHFKITVSVGKRSADTQRIFDTMAVRRAGYDPRMVRRTGDGCIEAFVPNGDGTFDNKYFDPDTMKLVFE